MIGQWPQYCQAQSQLQSNSTPVGAEFSLISKLSNHPTRPDHPTTRPDRRNSRVKQLLDQLVGMAFQNT